MTVEYLGLWDTVGALGLPRHFIFAHSFNRKYQFHDVSLSRMVRSARHALSIDEKRSTFAPSRWDNLNELNDLAAKREPNAGTPPYSQIWFPGDHASVGGGGDVNGLWQASLVWVVEGAQQRGLLVDQAKLDGYRKDIDCTASVYCMKRRTFSISSISVRRWRKGPDENGLSFISNVAQQRIREPKDKLSRSGPTVPRRCARSSRSTARNGASRAAEARAGYFAVSPCARPTSASSLAI